MRGRLRWLAAFGVIEIVVPFPLIAAGETRIDSSLAAIIIAAAPLFVALLALPFDHTERIGGRRLTGLVVGLVGVTALVGVDIAGRVGEPYVNPVVALALGVAFLDESPGPGAIVGLLLILFGSWLSTTEARRPAQEATAVAPEAQCCSGEELELVVQSQAVN